MQIIFDFFLGSEPDPLLAPVAYNMHYMAKLILGIFVFTLVGSFFRWLTKLIAGK